MRHVFDGHQSFYAFLSINSERLLSVAVVTAGLLCGAMMGSILLAV